MFVKECILYNMPAEYIVVSSPAKKFNDHKKVREIIDSEYFKETFKAAFDLQTKKVHFYCTNEEASQFAKDKYLDTNLGEIQTMSNRCIYFTQLYEDNSIKNNEIFLNYDTYYVRQNIMIDNDEIQLNSKSSYVINVLGWNENLSNPTINIPEESHYFLPIEMMYRYVGKLMKSNEEFKKGIEENERRIFINT